MSVSISVTISPQQVEVLDGELVIEHAEGPEAFAQAAGIMAVVRAPDGTTAVRTASEGDVETWIALYTGGTGHGLDAPGMTASVVAPLSAADIAVFVVSTATADLVLIGSDRLEDAIAALRDAGHDVRA